jgi:hypothetical protein
MNWAIYLQNREQEVSSLASPSRDHHRCRTDALHHHIRRLRQHGPFQANQLPTKWYGCPLCARDADNCCVTRGVFHLKCSSRSRRLEYISLLLCAAGVNAR